RVYDLQTSGRSSFYLRLFWPGPYPEWSGVARGCSHPHANPRRDFLHTLDRQAEQLRGAGIAHVPAPDLSRIGADTARFGLPDRYALLVPGGARHRPAKRWPAVRVGALARWFAGQGIEPVVLGTAAEGGVVDAVRAACAEARTLAGETDLADIVRLARGAACAVGNDTGPMHLIAAAGCPCVVLYSRESDPALCAQRGPDVTIVRRERLADLSEEEVANAVKVRRPSLTGR
ncbi:MAG: glycosyltransferase family 9 protein, partial [Alphaproteobacteria bacterium]|nr:glycosyltransferase family 9 protein [Alphaproteobacteria bacterium]